jgi:hypothetical protein
MVQINNTSILFFCATESHAGSLRNGIQQRECGNQFLKIETGITVAANRFSWAAQNLVHRVAKGLAVSRSR